MRILLTGGAGFIGSNLVESLLQDERVSFVRVLDNLATGFQKNIEEFLTDPKFEFISGLHCHPHRAGWAVPGKSHLPLLFPLPMR